MASSHDVLESQRKAAEDGTVVTETATLTLTQLYDNKIITGTHGSVAMTLTLPPATSAMKGLIRFISMGGAAVVKVYVEGGFGGAGASYDTCTLALGESLMVLCDGSYWYVLHNEPAGAA